MNATTRPTVDPASLSPKSRTAIAKYGYTNCELAYTHSTRGEGPSTIAAYLGLSGVAAANAAINAGREIETGLQTVDSFRDVYGVSKNAGRERTMSLGAFIGGSPKIDGIRFMLGTPGRVTISVTSCRWTTFIATLSAIQFDELSREIAYTTSLLDGRVPNASDHKLAGVELTKF